jgi:EAL domain-containing protein (putative c-di-GMP-specific phosphodiesterase class I)
MLVADPHEDLEPAPEPTPTSAAAAPEPLHGGSSATAEGLDDDSPGEPEDSSLALLRRRLCQSGDEGSIRVAFQPIVDLATHQVIGYEALARFSGDTTISPKTWFAEAAEMGVLREVEIAAIRAALAELDKLPADAFISLNVSPETAASEELCGLITAIDGSRVVLEITENEAAESYDEVSEAVGRLRASGVRIALDDTGSGDVSFSSLFEVHADIIKIDIGVTRGIDSDPMKEAMAAAIKSLADRLGAMSLAEGIETEDELDRLRRVGVQAGQGYLFGRPEAASG